MFPIQVEAPAVEPVSLSDMKAYLRVDDDAEDGLIAGLIEAARQAVETISRRILIARKWRLLLHDWPERGALSLPLSPLVAVDKVEVFDAAGLAAALSPDAFAADAFQDPPCVTFLDTPRPGRAHQGIAVEFRAGFGPAPEDVPAPLRLALKMIVARWFENRGDAPDALGHPAEALALIAAFRRPRL